MRIAFPLLLLLSPLALSAQTLSTREVTDRYLELTGAREYDQLLEVYSPDAVFHDPTGEVFGGPVAEGPVSGAARIVQMQKGWGLAAVEFPVTADFTVGEYSLYRGMFRAQYEGSSKWLAFPFVTVLRVVSGRIAERTDFGDYVEAFDLPGEISLETARTKPIADAYLAAYLARDVDAQIALVADDVRFQDPTSQVHGPPSGELYVGADVLAERRRAIFASLTAFDLEVAESFYAPHHAVYMGTTTYTVTGGQTFEQPAVFVIEVRDGRITRQWDFVDYSVGPIG
jgi:ketosteroid isomerase-like protein